MKERIVILYNILFIGYCTSHSHTRLDELSKDFSTLIQISEENTWIIDVIKLIIFHQSLPNITDHMNKPLLEDDYLYLFFDIRMIELMRIIMNNDSASHANFSSKSYSEELMNNIDMLRAKMILRLNGIKK